MTTLAEMDALVAAWVDTPEGQRTLDRCAEASRKACERIRKDIRVTPEQLRRPCTI